VAAASPIDLAVGTGHTERVGRNARKQPGHPSSGPPARARPDIPSAEPRAAPARTQLSANPPRPSFTDAGVTNGANYYYVVSASNANGSSANSAAVAANPGVLVAHPGGALFGAGRLRRLRCRHSECAEPANGIQGWLAQQFAIPVNPSGQLSNVAWMQANALISIEFDTTGVQSSFWRKLISSPDVLRQRMMLALTDLFVVNTSDHQLNYRGAAAAYYLDQLEANAFGNFKNSAAGRVAHAGHGSVFDLPG
jgi:hypothetical protein